MDDAIELSSLLASLEDINRRVSALVEQRTGSDGIDAELGSRRRLQRAVRSAERRR